MFLVCMFLVNLLYINVSTREISRGCRSSKKVPRRETHPSNINALLPFVLVIDINHHLSRKQQQINHPEFVSFPQTDTQSFQVGA